MKSKISLNDVTLVTVSSVQIKDTIDALVYNLKGIKFAAVKLLTHQKPVGLPDGVEYCQCKQIVSLEDYSRFIIYNLHNYIDTHYCLTIHRDGVILHPHLWRSEFLNYDYIGAPWPIDPAFRDFKGNYIRVGNGGFSIRSKKLLEMASKEKFPFKSKNAVLHEDDLICVQNRHLYEKNGIRFAPVEVAKYFSHEIQVPEIKGIKPFGFHNYRKQNRFYPRFPSWRTKFFNWFK